MLRTSPKEKAVYVHCKAGQGRSAMGIAAYLMKYGQNEDGSKMEYDKVVAHIQNHRPTSTIGNKLGGVYETSSNGPEKMEGLIGFACLLQQRENQKELANRPFQQLES